MAAIARNLGANIIKNTGDSFIYYFPKTSDSTIYLILKVSLIVV